MEVIAAATGSKERITAACVAVTWACAHISAAKARAVVTTAVKRIAAMMPGVHAKAGANNASGAAAVATKSTWIAASAVAVSFVVTRAAYRTWPAEKTAQMIVRTSPIAAGPCTGPTIAAVPASASNAATHAFHVAFRWKNGTSTTYNPVRN